MLIWNSWWVGALERCLAGLDGLAARRGRLVAKARHLETGERGEDAVFYFLLRRGFTVVARRWNDGPLPGDLDLIAWQGPVLCFVEVKTLTRQDVAVAEAAVDEHKRRTLRRLARQYLRHLPGEERPQTRFDIATVYALPGKAREIRLLEGAFGWSERE